jgi:sigma-B regulation protein RsbU (phosphoserine phosphatase)
MAEQRLIAESNTVASTPMAQHRFFMETQVSATNLSEIRSRLSAAIENLTTNQEVRHCVLMAMEEAIQNIIRHCYQPDELPGRVDIDARIDTNDLAIEIRDYGRPVALSSIRPRAWDPARPGGLGLKLIYATMDKVTFAHAPDGKGNVMRMRKHVV